MTYHVAVDVSGDVLDGLAAEGAAAGVDVIVVVSGGRVTEIVIVRLGLTIVRGHIVILASGCSWQNEEE